MGVKPVIALVTGGYSSEAVVSYKSALTIEKHLDPEKYEVYKVDVRPEGWFCEYGQEKIVVDRGDFSLSVPGKKITFDAVFMGIHGTPGEDGILQGFFDLLRIPYTTCDASSSAITFNKRYTVAVAAFAGISVARSLHLFAGSSVDPEAISRQLRLPVFVKPNSGGSSIGMSKVTDPDDIAGALEKAFREDDQVLVEEFIPGREFTVGVFRSLDGIRVLPITEIKTDNVFFDFNAKYHGQSEEITPAQVHDSVAEKVRQAALTVFEVFNCRGVVRMDFRVEERSGEPYFLEVNTVPGQSEASLIPQQVRAMGWDLTAFYSALVDEALSRKYR